MSSVFALATPATRSALCVFRVSGPGCLAAFDSMFTQALGEPRKFYQRSLMAGSTAVDTVGVIFFEGPSSYTGEDSFEIYAHGGLAVMGSIVDLFKSVGFDEAGPGEFTKRAFLNGKLSLSEAESVVDVINASSKEVLDISLNSLRGGFSDEVFGFSKRLDSLRKFVEGSIDFSDEDYDFIKEGGVVDDVSRLCADFGGFVNKCFLAGETGLKKTVLFIGPPNSGKSSLFNRLLGFDRALVSDVPGTTRDLIESEVFYNNSSFKVLDSAGIRETVDVVESKTGEGVIELKKKISSASAVRGLVDKEYFARNRHIKLFNEGLGHLEAAMVKLRSGFDVELAAEDLRLARVSLDEVVGVKTSDSLLGDIFNDFCIGK